MTPAVTMPGRRGEDIGRVLGRASANGDISNRQFATLGFVDHRGCRAQPRLSHGRGHQPVSALPVVAEFERCASVGTGADPEQTGYCNTANVTRPAPSSVSV